MQHQTLSFSLGLFCIMLSLLSVSAVNSVIYVQCSQLYFTSNQSYASNLNSLFTSMVESASVCNFDTFKISPPSCSPNDLVYGLFQCRGDLTIPDCRDCVTTAVSSLKTTCPVSIAGTIQTEGCLVKYNNTSSAFDEFQVEVFKSCGPSIGYYNADVINRIDDALGCLIVPNSGEYFRTGVSGSVVISVAQCEQDLSVSECDNCIVEARGRLRTECETSPWGDMHLGKCYIRYADHDDHGINGDDTCNNDCHRGTNIKYILKVVAIVFAVLSSGGVISYSYYISFTITKKVEKTEIKIQEVITKTQGAKEEVKKTAGVLKEEAKQVKKVGEGVKEGAKQVKKAVKEVKEIGAEMGRRLDTAHSYPFPQVHGAVCISNTPHTNDIWSSFLYPFNRVYSYRPNTCPAMLTDR